VPDRAAVGDRAATTRRMLEARSIAVVGASARPGSFGDRLTSEVLRSPGAPTIHLVHPNYDEVRGVPCLPTLGEVPDPVDLVLLGVPDAVIVDQLKVAAARGDGGAVVFGSVHGLSDDIIAVASPARMAVCGGGCMGFVNVAKGIRAIGYVERAHDVPGPIALITHSGSVFSALLRTHRRLEYSLAVSSGQELVTTASDYLQYAVELDETRVVGLFLETLRDVAGLRAGLARALERDIPVVALTVGASPTGRAMVSAHSGALAGDDAAWEALFSAYGVHRVNDLDELADSLEMFAIGRRLLPGGVRGGVATLHDSGGERALMADAAHAVDLPFATLTEATRARLGELLAPGLEPTNPLDVWGTGAETEGLFTDCMAALADDESVDVVALSIDMVHEFDEDESYPRAVEATLGRTAKPVVVLSHVAAALDQTQAARLRANGVPVFEGTYSGALALRHLFDHAEPPASPTEPEIDDVRRRRWRDRLLGGPLDAVTTMQLLADYGLRVATIAAADSREGSVTAAAKLGYPVVLKTDEPGVEHKSDVGGVRVGLADEADVRAAYDDIEHRLGSRVVVQRQASGQVELALGIVRDPLIGPLVILGIGGTLVEVVNRRRVALPPLSRAAAAELVDGFELVSTLLAGVRGNPPSDREAVADALVAIGQLAIELVDMLDALDVNPLLCSAEGAVAVDALVIPMPR
jgi:acyl-CoA synthetase (NDP forming)